MTKTSQRDKEEGRQEFVFKGSRKKNESENKIQENILLKFDNLFFFNLQRLPTLSSSGLLLPTDWPNALTQNVAHIYSKVIVELRCRVHLDIVVGAFKIYKYIYLTLFLGEICQYLCLQST